MSAIKTPVYYTKTKEGGHDVFLIYEPKKEELKSGYTAKCWKEDEAKAICDSINGNGVTNKEQKYREFVMKLQQQRAEAGVETKDMLSSKLTFLLAHAAMGMVTEAAEILDIIKKHLVYRRPLDFTKIKDECGDSLFYLTMAIIECGSNYNEIIDMNMAKLNARYKGRYTHEQANSRNLEEEKKAQMKVVSPALSGGITEEEALKAKYFDKDKGWIT